tara:strand:+ start:600 stop:731 length:132 start_codon:yes stop_codon:yes gene_type:complete
MNPLLILIALQEYYNDFGGINPYDISDQELLEFLGTSNIELES